MMPKPPARKEPFKIVDPALAKSARDGIAEIDARIKKNAAGAGQEPDVIQEHEAPSQKEAANNAANTAPADPVAKTPKAKREPKVKTTKAKRVSCLDAAAIVLADSSAPMRTTEIIEEVTKRGLWTSPGGKTPDATLHAAIIREIEEYPSRRCWIRRSSSSLTCSMCRSF